MDPKRFDLMTRRLARHASRRTVLRGIGGGVAGAVIAALGRGETEAARSTIPLGGPCYRDRQCINDYIPPRGAGLNPDLQIVYCADNGFYYDGDFNCCRYEGGFCYVDEHCRGYRGCVNRFCSFPEWGYG